MFNLIRKDFIISRFYVFVLFFVISLATLFILTLMYSKFGKIYFEYLIPLSIMMCVMYSFISIGLDSANDANVLYLSLPIKGYKIIYSRYITTILLAAIGLIGVVLMLYLFYKICYENHPVFNLLLSIRGITGMFAMILFTLSYLLPYVFRFGVSKGINIAVLVPITIAVLFPILKFIINVFEGVFRFDFAFFNKLLSSITNWVLSLHSINVYLLLFMILAILIYLSMKLSAWFSSRRDY